MRKTILMFVMAIVAVLSLVSFKDNDGGDVKVIAIVNKADWCSICKAYAGRTVEAFNSNNTDGYFQFIVNDITNDETKKASLPTIKKAGLENTLEGSLAAGVLSFYDASTRKLIAQVTVANTPEEIAATMKMVRSKAGK